MAQFMMLLLLLVVEGCLAVTNVNTFSCSGLAAARGSFQLHLLFTPKGQQPSFKAIFI